MIRTLLLALAAFATLALPHPAQADPADINAAARGVARIVIVGSDGEEVFLISHGTGFAVTPKMVVTNAHVVEQARQDSRLRIGVVPPEGRGGSFARVVAFSPRNDLALIELVEDLRLPPLTIAGQSERDAGAVFAVGYPSNVDRAQGLDLADLVRAQPPVKSQGFLSGRRPSRNFDTVLHTAPIATGNSGGPLLDDCGRVLGVNSFGADSDGPDAEFYFAVSMRELLPFLRANNVQPRVNASPCRSLAELDEAEQLRLEREQEQARQELAQRTEANREKRARAQLEAEQAVAEERENAMALASLALLLGLGAGVVAFQAKGREGKEKQLYIAGGIAAVSLVTALALWFTRPGLDEIDRRVSAAMNDGSDGSEGGEETVTAHGNLTCTLDPTRSRITGAPDATVEFEISEAGCVNNRTQYGFEAGAWSRVFVPNEEAVVNVTRYEPDTLTYRIDRYLLGQNAMSNAREERGKYSPPSCGAEGAGGTLGDMQSGVLAELPERPNERLVYRCEVGED